MWRYYNVPESEERQLYVSRNFVDVQDEWGVVVRIIEHYGEDKNDFLRFGGPGGWNDPDMLVIGNFGLSYDQAK